jgi:hypothetical protein
MYATATKINYIPNHHITTAMLYTEKVKSIFDKDHYSLKEFHQLIDFLVKDELQDDIRWIGHANFVECHYQQISVENAFYNDNIIGIKILAPVIDYNAKH